MESWSVIPWCMVGVGIILLAAAVDWSLWKLFCLIAGTVFVLIGSSLAGHQNAVW